MTVPTFSDLLDSVSAKKARRPFATNLAGTVTPDPFTWYLGRCPVCAGPLSIFSTSPDEDLDNDEVPGTRIVCKTTNCAPSAVASSLGIDPDEITVETLPPGLFLPNIHGDPVLPPPSGLRPRLVPFSNLNVTLPDFLVEGLVYTGTNSAIVGARGIGKSFFALDLACSLATGHVFHEMETKKSSVLYVAAEGIPGMKVRLDAWTEHHKINPGDFGNSMFLPEPVNLVDPDETADFLDLFRTDPFDVVFIDTLARNTAGMDENSRQAMDVFIKTLDEIHRLSPSTTVIIIHHTNAQGFSRGSSSLEGALDLVLKLEGNLDALSVERSKAKYTEAGGLFILQKVKNSSLPAPVLMLPLKADDSTKVSAAIERLTVIFQRLHFAIEGPYAAGFTETQARDVLGIIPTARGTKPDRKTVLRWWTDLRNAQLIVPMGASDEANPDPNEEASKALGKSTRYKIHGPALVQVKKHLDGDHPAIRSLLDSLLDNEPEDEDGDGMSLTVAA